jgi:CheY-like chemotaxis protein
MTHEEIVILLAEDDSGHATLVQRNLKRSGIVNRVQHVTDGQAALDYLRCEGPFAARAANGPMLLLLDINMPRLDGVEVLRQVKADPRIAKVPVIMLTTTDDPREVQKCYELGCSVYITKPVVYEDFIAAIKQLGLFLSIVTIPREDERV